MDGTCGKHFRKFAGAPDGPGYEIITRIGAGSSGDVWLAEVVETGRSLALKIPHRLEAAGSSAEFLQREVRILAKRD